MSRNQRIEVQYGFPPLTPIVRNLLIALFVLYCIELVARRAVGPAMDALLTMSPLGSGFLPWQIVTRYAIQGPSVFSVVIGGLMIYFLLPVLLGAFSRTQTLQAIGLSALGGTVFTLGMSALGVLDGVAFGWQPLVTVLFVLFGLHRPEATIRLFFVFPVPAKVIAWGTGALAFLFFLATFAMQSADLFGTWAACIGWWFWLGPGGRRRRLKKKASGIERKLRVLQGGQGDQIH